MIEKTAEFNKTLKVTLTESSFKFPRNTEPTGNEWVDYETQFYDDKHDHWGSYHHVSTKKTRFRVNIAKSFYIDVSNLEIKMV